MFDGISRSIDEFGNGILTALNDIQGVFGKELNVATPIKNSILDLVGNTPLIRLNKIGSHIPGIQFYLKAEFQNPTGSLRDRSSVGMIRDAERRGKLKPGSTILITGTGSSSVSISWAGRTLGYKVICALPKSIPVTETYKLTHYGAEIEYTDLDPLDFVKQKSKDTNYWYPDETRNMANPNQHFNTTGPEIYRDLVGKVDFLITGGGTGASVTGVGRYLRSMKESRTTKVLLSGFENSIFHDHFILKKKLNLPEIFDPTVVDEFLSISKEVAIHYQSDLMEKEGLPVGITTGMIVAAAISYAEKLPVDSFVTEQAKEPKNFVILSPDRE
ncbi:MAG: cysteine synthase family protein [Leptospira sp.]|nr:cysteine synthase family protein [Leptospira sp.]NCS94007.1 cysteine synthase family protein [Leptospira sp.]